MRIGIWIQTCYSRDCPINTAGDVFRRGQRKLGSEFQSNPVAIMNLMKHTRPSKLSLHLLDMGCSFHSHPSFTAKPKCPLLTASSKGCSSPAAPHCTPLWAWSSALPGGVSRKWSHFWGGTHRDLCHTSAPPWAPSPCPWSSGRPCRWFWNQASPHWTLPTASRCSGAPANHTARSVHWHKPAMLCCTAKYHSQVSNVCDHSSQIPQAAAQSTSCRH